MVQLINVIFLEFQPRYSPEIKESYTVTLSAFQKASFDSSLEWCISIFAPPSKL